ncbi:MAG: Coenzyme F420 hydrogenase/dehydrogenase, beta subunit C-terminal domain [Terrisporobacter sp.]|uniref:Coenzyme F420 hydrogenase/dehydrogenase, beta subunit C-terminal domain n=1 Tax=Terrisporobacter sp. TaxID=1965305 RepID=UPI0039A17D9C
MIDVKNKEECCGCYGCSNVCPRQCISMKIDNEGFWYPKVDNSKCINCNLCEKVCPIINTPQRDERKIIAYACKNKNNQEREKSSSGGVFTLLCKETINNGGVVFGAAFDKEFNVRHTYAETLDECIKFRGSKYVQSKIDNTYKKAKEFLEEGKIVLFSGTQCQIKGLNLYLRKKYNNLITVDIICHGVPSPKVFKSYINKLEKENNSRISDIRFRDKVKGWKEFSFTVKFTNGNIYSKTLRQDMYMKGFLSNLYLRPSCYTCTAKNYTSGSDISLADYWGVENKHPEINDDIGISLVLLNSKKGQDIFNQISNRIDRLNTDLEYATNCNPCIVKPVNYNPRRKEFFNKFNRSNIESVINKYTKVSFEQKVKNRLWGILSKIKKVYKL